MNLSEFRFELANLADEKYREFVMNGTPSERPFLGVRIPQIRGLVAKVPRENYIEFLDARPVVFEELIARGFIIAKLPYEEMLKYFDSQVDQIGDWGSCDTFCASLRLEVKKHREEFLEFKIEKLLKDPREFAVRIGLVLLLVAYVDFDYLWLIFDRVESLKDREEYYIRMAIAWLVAECFVKFPDETYGFLKKTRLPKWTFNKAISKICDSRRVSPEAKEQLKALKVA